MKPFSSAVGLVLAVACAPGEMGPVVDAGVSRDAAVVTRDAGAAGNDAGLMGLERDAGSSTANDAGRIAVDAGSVDAGVIITAWDGDAVSGGSAWAAPAGNPVVVQSAVARGGFALFWDVLPRSEPWSEWGWNWKSWQQPGTDVSAARIFSFAVRITGGNPPRDLVVSLRSATNQKYAHQPPAADGLRGINARTYDPLFADGQWHRIDVPMADMLSADNSSDFREVYEIFMGAGGSNYQLYLDDLRFQ